MLNFFSKNKQASQSDNLPNAGEDDFVINTQFDDVSPSSQRSFDQPNTHQGIRQQNIRQNDQQNSRLYSPSQGRNGGYSNNSYSANRRSSEESGRSGGNSYPDSSGRYSSNSSLNTAQNSRQNSAQNYGQNSTQNYGQNSAQNSHQNSAQNYGQNSAQNGSQNYGQFYNPYNQNNSEQYNSEQNYNSNSLNPRSSAPYYQSGQRTQYNTAQYNNTAQYSAFDSVDCNENGRSRDASLSSLFVSSSGGSEGKDTRTSRQFSGLSGPRGYSASNFARNTSNTSKRDADFLSATQSLEMSDQNPRNRVLSSESDENLKTAPFRLVRFAVKYICLLFLFCVGLLAVWDVSFCENNPLYQIYIKEMPEKNAGATSEPAQNSSDPESGDKGQTSNGSRQEDTKK